MVTVPDTSPQRDALLRYNNVAVALHWITAALLVWQLYTGFVFSDLPRGPDRGAWFDLHKTLGATILLLALVRLGWRVANPPPPYPPELPRWERLAATWNHRAFYFLIIAIPLSGLATISAGNIGVTRLLGGITLPLIPGIPETAGETMGGLHEILIFLTIGLAFIHIGAALKHQFIDKSRAAGRMPPFQAPGGEDVRVARSKT